MAQYKRKDEWQEQFIKWKSQKNQSKIKEISPVKINNPQIISPQQIPQFQKNKRKFKAKILIFTVLAILIFQIIFLAFYAGVSNSVFLVVVVSVFLLAFLFLSLLFAHRVYESSVHKIAPSKVIAFCYTLILANVLLSPKIYSIEWAFLGFLLITVIFYDFKIDSRFLILPALLLLGYIPFLLIGAQKEIAEITAVYVYYFLVVGVALQIIEHCKKTENSIEFDKFIETFISKEKTISLIAVWGVITIAIIIFNRFKSVELLKWSSVYVFVVLVVFYAIAYFQEQK